MRLFKYRDLRKPDATCLEYLARVLHQQAFWAARPDTLNDPTEFMWACDYTPTARTQALLAEVLHKTKVPAAADALYLAHLAVEQNKVEAYAAPVVALLQARTRHEVGLVCFGSSGNNEVLWSRYGGEGVGVCIELDVAAHLLGSQLRPVTYTTTKSLHIDQVLAATLEVHAASPVFETALLTKPTVPWEAEAEVRFVSKQQGVYVKLQDSTFLSITLGHGLSAGTVRMVRDIVAGLPYQLQVRDAEA